ncbi:MAG: CHAD domain-containing protein [Taibaiella sp.]|nr:CHAD domain-containing protein [Taibaiella sp.]
MRHNELEAEVEKAIKRLDSYAGTILAGSGTNEDIHQFRVTYKKLRAFLRLLYSGKGKNPLIQVKPIYTAAGEVRDMQIYLGIIAAKLEKDGGKSRVYTRMLEDEIEGKARKLQNTIRDFSFQHLVEKLTDTLPRPDDNTVIQFVHQQAEGFYSNIKEDATDEKLHAARKHLKDIIYNTTYLRTGKKDALFLEQQEQVKKLATLLGEYHDKNMIIAQLQTLPGEKIPVEEREALRRLEEEQHLEKATLKADMRKALQKLLDKAATSSLSTAAQAGMLVSSALVAGLAVFFLNYMRSNT